MSGQFGDQKIRTLDDRSQNIIGQVATYGLFYRLLEPHARQTQNSALRGHDVHSHALREPAADGRGSRPGLIGGRLQWELVEKLRCGAFVRAKDAQRWLRERTGRTLSLNALYYHLGKVGGVSRVPRKTHVRKDEAPVAAFREEAAERLLALIEDPHRPVRLWVADEHR
ncbi:MAG: winged helix-turn-helix domain-containing protein [Chthoniobacterales bacterium]|jgi:Winged helix-turn helix|nr:winged helix-turn-helix domain-containing protein [Chthoniobacterales bacterium]